MKQAYRLDYLSTKILLFLKEQFKEPQTWCFNELDFLNCMKVNKKIRKIIVKSDILKRSIRRVCLVCPIILKRGKNQLCLNNLFNSSKLKNSSLIAAKTSNKGFSLKNAGRHNKIAYIIGCYYISSLESFCVKSQVQANYFQKASFVYNF